MTFAVGTYGIDSASPGLDDNVAYKTGSRFHIRYSAGAATSPSNSSHAKNAHKLFGTNELKKILNSHQDFIANDEWYEDRTYEGSSAAAQDAPATLDFWQSRGLAKGASICLNLDVAPDMSKLLKIQQYIDKTNAVWNGYYHADMFYGGIPLLVALSKSGHTKHGWIPSAPSWSTANDDISDSYAPPAKRAWDLWKPTKSQLKPATQFLLQKLEGHKLVSCIWQTGNYWFGNGADEDYIILAGPLGSHLEAKGQPQPPSKPPVTPPHPSKHYGPMHGHGVPSAIHRGSGQYFGPIDGPKTSHGGYYAGERGYIKLIQQQLEFLGYVPGHAKPDGWADGIFDVRGGGVSVNGPTSAAVARFQHKHMPGTQFYGQVWWDDWTKLASLAKEDA